MGLRTLAAVGLALAATACGSLGSAPPGAPAEPVVERLGPQLFMVPFARDERGCVVYRLESPRRQGSQALYWRIGKGNFTTNPDAATCG